jgi:hypothetical protein
VKTDRVFIILCYSVAALGACMFAALVSAFGRAVHGPIPPLLTFVVVFVVALLSQLGLLLAPTAARSNRTAFRVAVAIACLPVLFAATAVLYSALFAGINRPIQWPAMTGYGLALLAVSSWAIYKLANRAGA